ncbi:MAG: hypothetical protein R2843_00180 [Thermomicrobiales bacterium]
MAAGATELWPFLPAGIPVPISSHAYPVLVRGRQISPRVKVTGPWLVKPVPDRPCFLLVVAGVDRGRGTTRRQRAPHFFLVTADRDASGRPVLPLPVAELLAWCWQRWEVEVMHRELKSSCGLGDQQAWSDHGAPTTLEWALWSYALLILTGVAVWGIGRPTAPGRPCRMLAAGAICGRPSPVPRRLAHKCDLDRQLRSTPPSGFATSSAVRPHHNAFRQPTPCRNRTASSPKTANPKPRSTC